MANSNLILVTMNSILHISVENYVCQNFNNTFLAKKVQVLTEHASEMELVLIYLYLDSC